MTNPLLGPYADEQAMMTPPGYTSRCVPLTEAWMKMALATRVITPPENEGRSHLGLLLIGAFVGLVIVVPWLLWVGSR